MRNSYFLPSLELKQKKTSKISPTLITESIDATASFPVFTSSRPIRGNSSEIVSVSVQLYNQQITEHPQLLYSKEINLAAFSEELQNGNLGLPESARAEIIEVMRKYKLGQNLKNSQLPLGLSATFTGINLEGSPFTLHHPLSASGENFSFYGKSSLKDILPPEGMGRFFNRAYYLNFFRTPCSQILE